MFRMVNAKSYEDAHNCTLIKKAHSKYHNELLKTYILLYLQLTHT